MEFSMKSNIGLNEILQFIFLLLSSRLGFLINNYSDPIKRKWMCTILGFVDVSVILRGNMWHFLLSIVVTIMIIVLTGPRYCHITSFVSMFFYLMMYRLIQFTQGIIIDQILTIIQSMAAMAVVGVAFDINLAYKKLKDCKNDNKEDYGEVDMLTVGFMDIFHYVFNYATICTGPYVRYQVYVDFINLPYSRAIRRSRISNIMVTIASPLLLITFVIMTEYWPSEYVFTEEFAQCGFMYRLNYCLIQWVRFRAFLYPSFGVVRCHSLISGIGAYPVECKAASAHGPTVNIKNMRKVTFEEAKAMDLDMKTTEIIGDHKFETEATITEATRHWNKSIQYWLGFYIYKTLPKTLGRMARVFLTLAVSCLWHGIYPSLFLASMFCAYYYTVEMLYIRLHKQLTGKMYTAMNIIFWISRQYFWSWSMMCYMLLDIDAAMGYYKLTYFAPLLFTISMHVLYVMIFSKIVLNEKN